MALLLLVLAVAGCVTLNKSAPLVFPSPDTASYRSPTGREWSKRSAQVTADRSSVEFVPEGTDAKAWTELLLFVRAKTGFSTAEIRRILTLVSTEDDKEMTFTITEHADEAFVTYESPRWHEKGLQKIVRTPEGYLVVGYQTRLGPSGESRYQQWLQLLQPAVLVAPPSTSGI